MNRLRGNGKKLVLNRTVFRALSSGNLNEVHGAIIPDTRIDCSRTCGCAGGSQGGSNVPGVC